MNAHMKLVGYGTPNLEFVIHVLTICFQKISWMTDIQKENVAHMLASMHLVLRQQDGGERSRGEYGHVNNTSYEKFVERCCSNS